ncbi:MAG TPA: ribosome small subunit-dependent GTPase A [Chitinophagaceae bacterium]|nr:ribosome small subunit-dependent GTPase A [Chitinophagaceae bacterium]
MEAIVYKSTGSWYLVRTENGKFINCRLAGKLKLDKNISSSNPIAVGDSVKIIPEKKQDTAVITEIGERENYIVRSSPQQRVRRHVLASNIDQAVLLATLRFPVTSRGLIDRFLVTAAAYHIPAVIAFNKTDCYREKEWEKLEAFRLVYQAMGYNICQISAQNGMIDELKVLLKGKKTLLAGHSGVGKSTVINRLLPERKIKTQSVSEWSGKGLHTTTYAEMFELPFGGNIIDTPGIREWGIVDIEEAELSHYFIDMQPFIGECKFNDCLHVDEPGCVIKKAVAEGQIDFDRFESYLSILASLQERH